MKNKSFTGSLIAIAMMAGHLLSPNAMLAQETTEKGFDVYGHIRTDFFAQSRNCVNSVNDLFSLFAAPEGQQASAGMHSITTRMGADFYAPGILGAKQAKGKIEALVLKPYACIHKDRIATPSLDGAVEEVLSTNATYNPLGYNKINIGTLLKEVNGRWRVVGNSRHTTVVHCFIVDSYSLSDTSIKA